MTVIATIDEDGDIFIEATGDIYKGLMSHGSTIEEAFTNFGEAAKLYIETGESLLGHPLYKETN